MSIPKSDGGKQPLGIPTMPSFIACCRCAPAVRFIAREIPAASFGGDEAANCGGLFIVGPCLTGET